MMTKIFAAEEAVSTTAESETTALAGVNYGDIFFTLFIFLLLLFLMKKFVFSKVNEILNERQTQIVKDIDDAQSLKENAQALENEKNEKLKEAKNRSLEIIEESKKDAMKLSNEIKEKAKDDANNIIDEAQKSIIQEKEKLKINSQKDAIDGAFVIASKILKSEMDEKKQKAIIDDFLASER